MAELWLGFRTLVRWGGVVAWGYHFNKRMRGWWLGFSALVRCGGVVAWF